MPSSASAATVVYTLSLHDALPILAHRSADARELSVAISRGAFEYQGQKCSAASRAYIPSNLWEEVKGLILGDLKTMKMGPTEDFTRSEERRVGKEGRARR